MAPGVTDVLALHQDYFQQDGPCKRVQPEVLKMLEVVTTSTDSDERDMAACERSRHPLPIIKVSGSDAPARDKHRRNATVTGVTDEARKVLEQFLKRSLSQNDASPYRREIQNLGGMGTIEEHPQDSYLRSDSYLKAAANDHAPAEFSGEPPEPDYVQMHTLINKTNSVSSQSSYGVSLRSRSRSPSDKFLHAVHPPKVESKPKHKIQKKCAFEDSSSSSTEDYEYVENELLTRKKKSFFRWATERLRQSFRRKKEAAANSDAESPKDEIVPFEGKKKPKKKKQKSKLRLSVKRSGSEKSKSSSTPNEVSAATKQEAAVSDGVYPPEELGYSAEEKRRKSPSSSKQYSKKEKDKEGVFESILRQLRRSGSKLKRKGSKERQKSSSADNLVIRPLSKEHEKVLRRYIDTRPKGESENDSDQHTVRSLHEVTTHKVDMHLPTPGKPPASPLAYADESQFGQGHHSLRRKMHLDGLNAFQPEALVLPPDASLEHDYVEMDDDDDDIFPVKKFESDDLDDTDGKVTSLKNTLYSNKPFHERTETEKEDLYEKIASQLALIATQYNVDSVSPALPNTNLTRPVTENPGTSRVNTPEKSTLSDKSAKEPKPEVKEVVKGTILEKEIGALLREKGDKASQLLPETTSIVAELVRNASYSRFKQIVNANVGNDPGWQQIAMTFRLTQTAVQLAGMGTAVALQIKEMTLQYFEDRFAGWIVGQGGWESMVEDTNTESELD